MRALALTLALALALAPGLARAHPHVFIDGGVDFLFDAEGRLDRLRVTWIYDPLTSLIMLEDLAIPADAPLDAAARARLAAYQTEWIPGFDGDSYLRRDDASVRLSGPLAPDATLRDGRAVISFERRLAEPFHPEGETVVEMYDPTYFTAYLVTEAPRLEGAPAGCAAQVEGFTPTGPLMALQQSLSALGTDEDPEDAEVGALFADKVRLTC